MFPTESCLHLLVEQYVAETTSPWLTQEVLDWSLEENESPGLLRQLFNFILQLTSRTLLLAMNFLHCIRYTMESVINLNGLRYLILYF